MIFRQNYNKWAEAVCSRVKDDKRGKVMSKDVGLAFGHVAQHRKCMVSRRFNSTIFSLERMQEFTSSSCRICAANIQLPNGKTGFLLSISRFYLNLYPYLKLK